MGEAAVKAAATIGYRGAGTVEFIADSSRGLGSGGFFFMEMNTRLQVEHPVTEAITGLDLVEWQLRVAAGEPLPLSQDAVPRHGHAVEARIYAEEPAAGFRPSTGRLWAATFPSGDGVRVDAGAEEGSVVSPYYDSMLAKVVALGDTRAQALDRLAAAMGSTRIAGPSTNLRFLAAIVAHPEFRAGGVDTGFVDRELPHLVGAPADPSYAAPAVAEWFARERARFARPTLGPWARADAFEPGGQQRADRVEVEVDGDRGEAEIAWSEAGPVVRAVLEKAVPAAGAPGEDVVWAGREAFILADGGQLRVSFPDPLARDLDEEDGGGEVLAPMPGRVAAVSVAPGQAVAKGDLLFTLEAMKMEHSILAPLAGTVRAVKHAAGEQVEQGAVVVSIDPAGEGAGRQPVD
jgi:3-methylcrotonyl-CoA carboxylase alpha subunit